MNFFRKRRHTVIKQPDLNPTDALKTELKRQETWLKQLHIYSNNLHNYTDSIKESNSKHKKEILEHIDHITTWVDYLNKSNLELKNELYELKNGMRKTLRADFEAYHKTLLDYITLKLNEEHAKKETIKEEVAQELKKELLSLFESRKPQKTSISNAETDKDVKNITHYVSEVELSNPEKELLTLFFNENKPLTYENIAKKMNKSLNTTRVYMNSLKSKKNIFDEFSTPKGTKVFSLKNSELVKTLFNLK